jgi:hypothetical protein
VCLGAKSDRSHRSLVTSKLRAGQPFTFSSIGIFSLVTIAPAASLCKTIALDPKYCHPTHGTELVVVVVLNLFAPCVAKNNLLVAWQNRK